MGEEDGVSKEEKRSQTGQKHNIYVDFCRCPCRDDDEGAGSGGGSDEIESPAEGMELSLYRVTDYEDSFTLPEKFQNYQVSLDQKDQDGWKGVARTLADYIGRDGIEADAVTKSGSDRSARFEDLSRGLYLVSAKEIEVQ